MAFQEEEEWEAEDWEAEETEETTDVKDESTAYLDFLSQQASKFNAAVGEDEGDDELEEESLLETPLDSMEPYQLFKSTLESKFMPCVLGCLHANSVPAMHTTQPQFYTQLYGMLSPEEQIIVQNAFEQATKIQQAQQQASAGDATTPTQTNGGA